MKFQKTIELWGLEDKILSGEIKLQCGQWVTCGGGPKSRYIGTDGRSIDCVHGGTAQQVSRKFLSRVKIDKLAKRRAELVANKNLSPAVRKAAIQHLARQVIAISAA